MNRAGGSKPDHRETSRQNSGRWAVKIARAHAAALGPLRSIAAVRACDLGEYVWLSVQQPEAELQLQLRGLPGGTCFQVLDDRQVAPLGKQVPVDRLPAGEWTALGDWLAVELGAAQLAGATPERTTLRLVRCGTPAGVNCLLCDAADWQALATRAPALRLSRWTFAADSRGRVVVRGAPPPSIPGTQFVERAGIAIPAGYRWEFELDADVVARIHGVSNGDLAIVHASGEWELLPADAFVGATRSAVRALVVGDAG